MQVRLLFDKEAQEPGLKTGWGVSFLIGGKVLFDTGENGDWLIGNMEKLGVDFDKIEAVVISHDHWDHTGGLWKVLEKKKMPVYGCAGFSREFKKQVKKSGCEFIECKKVTPIIDDVYATGEISGLYFGRGIAEQAVVIKSEKRISVLTGCSHPGIVKIAKYVRSKFPESDFYFIGGGFHLMQKDKREIRIIASELKKMQIVKAGPTHCSGKSAEEIFKAEFGDNFVSIRVGQRL
ncbi:MAG: MBL fold metallo-hydrolase [Candidatus Omnitrophota bacterium]|nr:MAG: MBL fold metallo-hydrolase [Candidatus Omnitrophota bacterium]